MKKHLAILAVFAMVSTNAFAGSLIPSNDHRPKVESLQSCIAATDWDFRHVSGLRDPWSVIDVRNGITVQSQQFKDLFALQQAYIVPRNTECHEKYSK